MTCRLDHDRPKKKNQARSNGQDKLQDPIDPIFPRAIESWKGALESFNIADARFVYAKPIATDLGYVFPEPAMFVRTQTVERRETYFRTWLKYRTALIYRVSSKDFAATPMPGTIWRDLLTYEYSQQKLTDSTKETKSNKLRALAVDFLQNCLQAEDVTLMGLEKGEVVWNGKVCETLTNAEREEILWELAELNFRFELLALDERATTSAEDRRELISACFPGCTSRSLLVADLGTANHGLADRNWENRATFLHALKRIMMGWRGNVPPIIQVQKFKWIRQDMQELEDAITSFYIKSFYNYFRRPPIVPRGLSHTASLYIPELPRITIQDPHPEVFYDVNKLLPL